MKIIASKGSILGGIQHLMAFERNTAFTPEHQDELRARLRQMQGEGK